MQFRGDGCDHELGSMKFVETRASSGHKVSFRVLKEGMCSFNAVPSPEGSLHFNQPAIKDRLLTAGTNCKQQHRY